MAQPATASDKLPESYFPLVYDELRLLARHLMRQEDAAHTWQATELLHEAILKLARGSALQNVSNPVHLRALAIRAMRQVLADHARAKAATKRGNKPARVDLNDGIGMAESDPETFLLVDEIVTELANTVPNDARIFEMKFITGCTRTEIAESLGVDEQSVKTALASIRALVRRKCAKVAHG